MSFVKKNALKYLNFCLKQSDKISTKVFFTFEFSSFIEMGVHQGEISRAAIKKLNNKVNKIKKNSYYIGYEANKFNIKKYRLASLNILCRAVVPKHYKSKNTILHIPIRKKGDDISSGKSSILKRDMNGWYKNVEVKVKVITVDEIPLIKENVKNLAVWIDIEGISAQIANEIAQKTNVNFIHFELDTRNTRDYVDSLDLNIDAVKRNFYMIKSRSSHNQFNVIAFKHWTIKIIFYSLLLNILDLIVKFLLFFRGVTKFIFSKD
jgi:hypothetical protein